MWWHLGVVTSAVLLCAYALVAIVIAVPLLRSGQFRSNLLGTATAGIFTSCALHHALLLFFLVAPSLGVQAERGVAMRDSWGIALSLVDLIAVTMGIYYWTLRRSYGSMLQGAKLFDDLHERERQALELNDSVLQGLVVARMALDLEQPQRAVAALDVAIGSASDMITELLGTKQGFSEGLLRSSPALLAEAERKQAEAAARDAGSFGGAT